MLRHRFCLLVICACSMTFSSVIGQDGANKAFLLNVGKGPVPNDTGMDDKTVLSLVDSAELGGKALKVPLVAEDSFGVSMSAVSNWKKYERLRFSAFNPSKEAIDLELVVIHSRSKAYETRVVQPIQLKPGKNDFKVKIDELNNVDGSVPDLAQVTRWYFADASKRDSTFYVGDIWLESGDAAAPAPSPSTPAAAGRGGSPPLVGYRVTGRIGEAEVDLTFTPFVASAPPDVTGAPATAPRPAPQIAIDQARLARIKAAKMPAVTRPVSFETPEADAIVSALEIFPPDNAMNLDVSDWPLHPNSQNIVASIGAEKPLRYNPDMGYVLVPPAQAKVQVPIGIPDESDKGPFPVPNNIPIEGWPARYTREKIAINLEQLQRNVNNEDDDRHAIVVDPVNRLLYEFYQMRRTRGGWQATHASIFDLKSNKLRPDGWTSADAAGLPIFPLVVRHDELKRGAIEHALRLTVSKSRKAYVYPATHYASDQTDENLPRMGERLRLRKDYDVSGHSPPVQTILKALQKYGVLVADNGIDWAVSVTPDPRIPELHAELRKVRGSDFEVVEAPAGYQPPE